MLRIHCLQLWWNLSDPAMEVCIDPALSAQLGMRQKTWTG